MRYEERTVAELRNIAKKRNIKKPYLLNKKQLIDSLRRNRTVRYQPTSTDVSFTRYKKFKSCVTKLKKKCPNCDNRYHYGICNKSIYGK